MRIDAQALTLLALLTYAAYAHVCSRMLWVCLANRRTGTHFSCFTGTKVLSMSCIMMRSMLFCSACRRRFTVSHFTCFTGTKVPVSYIMMRSMRLRSACRRRFTVCHFTCFTGTKVPVSYIMMRSMRLRSACRRRCTVSWKPSPRANCCWYADWYKSTC